MSSTVLTTATFQETVSRDGAVLVDFWARWCRPCRAFAPVVEASAASSCPRGPAHRPVRHC